MYDIVISQFIILQINSLTVTVRADDEDAPRLWTITPNEIPSSCTPHMTCLIVAHVKRSSPQ